MSNVLRSVLTEPRAPHPPALGWRDWALVALLVVAAVLEGILRTDLVWRPVAVVVGTGLVFVLLWRRTHPLAATAVMFGTVTAMELATVVAGSESTGLYTMLYLLVMPYSLFRWASGREAAIGLVIVLVPATLSLVADYTGPADAIAGMAILLAAFALGAAARYRANARLRDLDRVKSAERVELARELHDTVAHHVSAIAIQAQAGRALASTRPGAPLEALGVIEAEASATLAEMRAMVRVLRDGAAVDFAPQPGVGDIGRLARTGAGNPQVDVLLSGGLADLPGPVEVALYRLAQESITNALRHARHATQVDVSVVGDDTSVRLSVRDDGDPVPPASDDSPGYGLVGMAERARLLGGTFQAGPQPGGGWAVEAVLPRGVSR